MRRSWNTEGLMSALPSGTFTFLFSDIEGSTRHWQSDDDGMRRSLALHDEILRAAITGGEGHVLKHTGDGMISVFARAADAIAAAAAAQRSLGEADWGSSVLLVRMGIHTGDAQERDGDYFGPTLNRAARLMAVAHGGQILISGATADLSEGGLHGDIALVDLGEHALRDLDRRERIYQVRAPGLKSEFPPLDTACGELRAFPVSRTTLIGREQLLARVAERLEHSALVTLTGVGGSGKTRLAIEAGRAAAARLPDGGAFVDLAPLGDADLLAATVASVVGVPDMRDVAESGRGRSENALAAYLADREMLIVLDNCEHLIDACADLVDRLLGECGGVRILATSREGLAVDGESTVAVPSLGLPKENEPVTSSAAVRLLVDRVAAARSGLDLLPDHEAAVVEICKRLDGIPLAIELAAAQIVHSTPEEIAARLGDRFRLLSGGRRRVQRQATLQATVDWSYDLLDDRERMLLARLGVFAGDFSLAAAQSVGSDDKIAPHDVLSLLASLVAKSLVVADARAESTRYRLLETIRIYAEERLMERGEAETVRDRHRDWFLQLVEALDRERFSCPLVRTIDDYREIAIEHDQLRAALAWCAETGRLDLAARIAVAVDVLWMSLGCQDEALRWLDLALSDSDLDPVLQARCRTIKGWTTMQRGDFVALPALADEALAAAEAAGLVESRAAEAYGPLSFKAFSLVYSSQAQGREMLASVVEIARKQGSAPAKIIARWMIGAMWLGEQKYDEACSVMMDGLSEKAGLAPGYWDHVMINELIVALHLAGRHEEAMQTAREHLLRTPSEHYDQLTASFGWLGPILARLSFEPAAVLPELLTRFAEADRTRAPVIAQYALTLIAIVLSRCNDHETASIVLSSARTAGELPFRSPGHYALYRHYGPILRENLGAEKAAHCRARGNGMPMREAIELVRASEVGRAALAAE